MSKPNLTLNKKVLIDLMLLESTFALRGPIKFLPVKFDVINEKLKKLKSFYFCIIIYSNHLNAGQVWYLNGTENAQLSNGPIFQWWSENRTKRYV